MVFYIFTVINNMPKAKKPVKVGEGKSTTSEWVSQKVEERQAYSLSGVSGTASGVFSNAPLQPHQLYMADPVAGSYLGFSTLYNDPLRSIYKVHSRGFEEFYSRPQMRNVNVRFEELQEQLNKATIALENVALQKASYALNRILEVATDFEITIVSTWLKIESWSDVTTLIIVPIEDYSEDKIEHLFTTSNLISSELSSPDFNWKYDIIYFSEYLNYDKITSDGFSLQYGQLFKSRQA
jgi:hypothetical protein